MYATSFCIVSLINAGKLLLHGDNINQKLHFTFKFLLVAKEKEMIVEIKLSKNKFLIGRKGFFYK